MTDRYYINIIIRKIEKKLNWKKVSLWTDNEFKKLSLLILEETSISISPQTLKRLFGKVKYKDDYTTQPATKDALARFLGYQTGMHSLKISHIVYQDLLISYLTELMIKA